MRKRIVPRLSGLLTLALGAAACTDSDTSPPPGDGGTPIDPLSYTVTEPGPFTCGHRIVETTYTLPAGAGERTIPVHFWYPSEATEGDHPKYAGIFEDTIALDDVPPAKPAWKEGMPVLVHSHGHKGFAGNSARLMCHFASHGWLAAAPDHVGNLLGDSPDIRPLAIYFERSLDLRATLDLAVSLPEGDPLAGLADLTRVAMSGHSLGAYTAWGAAGAAFDVAAIQAKCDAGEVTECSPEHLDVFKTDLSEPRVKVIVPMAGDNSAFFGASGLGAMKVPVLLMSGSLDPVNADVIFGGVTGVDMTWVEIDGGCHQLFGLGNKFLGDAECLDLPDEEGFAIVNPWVLAHARVHVLGDTGEEVTAITGAMKSLSPRAHVQHKGP